MESCAFAIMFSGSTFDNVRRNRESRAACLAREREAFIDRKLLFRKQMNADEEIVRSLPCNE
jgi:hypothetical protein